MTVLGLEDEEQLQTFVRRIDSFLREHERR